MDFERILQKCGDSGRYQYLMLGLLAYMGFCTTVHYFSQNMISFVPQHYCYHEQLENKSFEEIATIYAPFGKQASCTHLDSIDGANITVSTEPCTRWMYKYDYNFKSMNAEFNWVCDDAYKARIGQSLFFIGSLLGTFIFGWLGDRIGRVPTLILANQCGFIGDFSTTYATNLIQFTICRFISGWAADANFYLMYILVLEYLSPELRNLAFSGTLGVSFCLGALTAPWLSVLAGNWRVYMIFSAMSSLCVALYYFVVQESAQWLITRNNIAGAIARLKLIAHFNGRKVPQEDFDAFRAHCVEKRLETEQQVNVKLFDMMKTPHLRRTFFMIIIIFMSACLAFNTITRNVEGLGLSPFVVFSLFALTVPPSGFLQGILLSRIGRKATAFLALTVTSIFSFTAGIAYLFDNVRSNPLVLLAIALPMRLGVSMCYTASSQFASEILPTCVRARGLSVVHLIGSAASFASPYLIHLSTKLQSGPSFILTLVLTAGALSTLLLPETNNRQLPITLEDGEQFGKGESMFTFDCLKPNDDDIEKHPKEELALSETINKPK